MSIYFEPNSLFFLLCIPRRNGFSHHHWLLWVSPEFTLLREVSQVSLSNIMMFHLMLDLARRCRLGIRAWICSVQKCCRQHPACLKCPLTFHSRGNPCLCSLCVLHVSYLMHFFSLVVCHQLVRRALQLGIQSSMIGSALILPPWSCWCSFYFLTPWFWLSWCMDNSSSFFLVLDFSAWV